MWSYLIRLKRLDNAEILLNLYSESSNYGFINVYRWFYTHDFLLSKSPRFLYNEQSEADDFRGGL